MQYFSLLIVGVAAAQIQNDVYRRDIITDPTRREIPTPEPVVSKSTDSTVTKPTSKNENNSNTKPSNAAPNSSKPKATPNAQDSPIVDINSGAINLSATFVAFSATLITARFLTL